jgi:amino acid ABC superfamily ATP binding cassette transporter
MWSAIIGFSAHIAAYTKPVIPLRVAGLFNFIQEMVLMNRTKRIVAAILAIAMCAVLFAGCGTKTESAKTGVEDGVLTVAMECAYAPYNWTQSDDSNGAVPIKDSSDYANGYDIMMAKKICEANGWKLEVVRLDWDSLVPAVQTGKVDAVIAGQSMTEERMQQVDFAGPYLYASIVCMTKQNSKYANATSLADLAGAKCTSQLGTIWYTTCLPQINGALIQTAQETAPSMLMALETGAVDFICTDMPTAQGALIAYSDLKILNLPDNAFKVDEGDINIGISVKKGNTELKDKINSALAGMTADDFNKIMNEATKIQPLSK